MKLPLFCRAPSLLLLAAASASCSSSEPTSSAADAGAVSVDAEPAATDWTLLVDGDWEVPAGDEFYKCVRKTVSEDTFITGFKSIGPIGTHHTVLTIGGPSGPDGISDCNAGTNAPQMIFGSGVGDVEYLFPEGVGIKIEAGQQLMLNLHLFNVSDAAITGTSGTEALLVAAGDIVHEAENVLMGTTSLDIGPGESLQEGACTMDQDVTLLTVGPHMHQLGTHMKVEAIRSEGDMVLHDAAYDFYDQKLYPMEPLQLKEGDRIKVSCSYDNTTGESVGFGDSSNQEMCFAGMYRYPRRPQSPFGILCVR